MDYKSPCERFPDRWDEFIDDNPHEMAKWARHEAAIEGCLACTVFVKCLAVREAINPAKPEIVGIIAGELISTPSKAKRYRTRGRPRVNGGPPASEVLSTDEILERIRKSGKTHCKNGHERTLVTASINLRDGSIRCRVCRNKSCNDSRTRRRAEARAQG